MDSTGSILMTTITKIRTYLDDPSLDAKYTNDFIVRQIIEPEMANVITALNNQREEPVICKYSLDGVTDNTEYYELPPNVGQIVRIVKLDANGSVTNDIEQRDGSDPRGPGWHVDGRDLHFRPLWDEVPAASSTATITNTEATVENETIEIISTDLTSRTYVSKADATGSDLHFDHDGTPTQRMASLKAAIESSGGHAGKITVTQNVGVLTLTQATVGVAGDTVITEGLSNTTKTNFTGGVDISAIASDHEVWYIPSGDFNPHYSAAGGTLATLNAVTLDTTPNVGMVDMRQSAYIGGVIRVWGDTNTVVQERVITSYNADTKVIGVRTAFTSPIANGAVRYEIVPEFMGHVWQSIAIASAMNLGVARNINEKHMAFLKEQFTITIQTAGSLLSQKINNKSIAPENSVLYTMLQRIQWGLPEQVEKGMSNDYIMRSVVIPKMAELMTTINSRTDSPIVVRHSLTLEGDPTDTEFYDLPPCIYKALRIAKISATGMVTHELRQRDENDPNGPGWKIEGNRLSIRPFPTVDDATFDLWYIPNGDFIPHYANNGSINSTGKTLTLTSGGLFSRMLGYVDKRNNAYAGATLRIFESDGSISERTITSHSASAGTVTVTEAFTTASGNTTVAYEIVTPWLTQIMSAVVSKAVLELVALKGQIQEADMAILAEASKSALQSVIANIRERNAQEIVPNKDSALHMILEKTKTILGDIARELDYSDDYIFRHGIMPEYSRVMSRIQNSSSDYVIEKTTISLVKDQQYYVLPSCIGEIIRIVTVNDNGRIKTELLPRNQFNPSGPNWSLEGNELAIRPYPPTNEDVEVWFIPTTDIKPHYAEDGVLNSVGTSLTTLSSGAWGSQILGDVDRREDIYQGCLLRILSPTSGRLQERIIKQHSAEGKWLILRSAFTDNAITDETVIYEIVPVHFTAVSEAVAQGAAMNLLVSARRVTKAQHVMLLSNFKSAMKTAMDHFTFLQNRSPKKYERDTIDNKDRYGGIYGLR